MKFFPKIWVKPNVLKNLSVIFEIVVSLTQLLRGICSQVPTLSLDKLFHHLNCLLNKRKGCNRPLTSEIYFISSRFTLPTHLSKSDKKGPAWSLGAQGYLIPSSPIVRFLATPRRHIITSPDTLATITNSSWYVSYRFLIFSGIFSKSATSYSLIHRGPTTGAQAVCGPLQRYQWRAEAFMKNFKSEICWKACEVTSVLLNSSLWIKCICTRTMNKTFSVYHYCFGFMYLFISRSD